MSIVGLRISQACLMSSVIYVTLIKCCLSEQLKAVYTCKLGHSKLAFSLLCNPAIVTLWCNNYQKFTGSSSTVCEWVSGTPIQYFDYSTLTTVCETGKICAIFHWQISCICQMSVLSSLHARLSNFSPSLQFLFWKCPVDFEPSISEVSLTNEVSSVTP